MISPPTSSIGTEADQLSNAAIGIFDSGIGGLSVLRHIHARSPDERLLYFADTAFAPYGQRSEEWIVARTLAIADYLFARPVKALVIACNTATAAAVKAVREKHSNKIVIGVEPGLKPATHLTKTGHIGVLATQVTLASNKFSQLRAQLEADSGKQFHSQACNGLVDLIERCEIDSSQTRELLRTYLAPLLTQDVDTVVLGCTHYPFVRSTIEQLWYELSSRDVNIIDTGDAVARRLEDLLLHVGLRRPNTSMVLAAPIEALTTSNKDTLAPAFRHLLGLNPAVETISIPALQT